MEFISVYFDTTLHRNYFIIGYASQNIKRIADKSESIAYCFDLDENKMEFHLITKSSSYKNMAVMFSTEENQQKVDNATESANAWQSMTE